MDINSITNVEQASLAHKNCLNKKSPSENTTKSSEKPSKDYLNPNEGDKDGDGVDF